MDMAASQLNHPSVANLDLAVARRGAVANHEMISETVRHAPNVAMIVIKNPGVSLASPAIVHHDVLPTIPGYSSIINGSTHCRRQITPTAVVMTGWDVFVLAALLLDNDFIVVGMKIENEPAMVLLFWSRLSPGFLFRRYRGPG